MYYKFENSFPRVSAPVLEIIWFKIIENTFSDNVTSSLIEKTFSYLEGFTSQINGEYYKHYLQNNGRENDETKNRFEIHFQRHNKQACVDHI